MSTSLFALLLVWGVYTVIYYLGVPYHGAALTTDEAMKSVAASCGDGAAVVCRGMSMFLPFVFHTIGRAAPFLWYAIVSLVLFGLFAGWQTFSLGRTTIRIAWTPWKLLLLFVASVWLFSTVISFGTMNGRPERAFIEPTKDTYNVSEHALGSLQADYQDLLTRGCLDPVGETQSGAKAYTMTAVCIEEAFIQRVLSQVLFVLLLLGEFLILGRMALTALRVKTQSLLLEALLSVAMGASMGIIILWLIAALGVYVGTAGWITASLIPIIGFRHTQYWLRTFFQYRWTQEYRWYDITLLLGWLLISYLALNFLEVVRPFPIGWDDLGSYLNRPRQLVTYGFLISSMSNFDWTYLTSLGYLLFGYNNPFGATASMMVNWSAGLLAVLAVFALARTFLGNRSGFLSALLYYSLPLVGHFSFADMKIDNAVFFFGALATLAVMLAVLPQQMENGEWRIENDEQKGRILHSSFSILHSAKLLFLAGIFVGIAFGTKVTVVMVILPLGAVLAGAMLGPAAFLGATLFLFALLSWGKTISLELILPRAMNVASPAFAQPLLTALCVLAGLLCLGWAARRRGNLLPAALFAGAFCAGVIIAVLPWMEKNTIQTGRILPRLSMSAPNTLSPQIDSSLLPPDLAVNRNSSFCQPSGSTEELDRYWGFGHGWSHYVTLPWRTVMNLDSTGYYVTTIPALLLFPLLLLLPFFWSPGAKWLRLLFSATVIMIIEWIFAANGVPWYGVGILLGLTIGMEALVRKAPDTPNRLLASLLIGCSLLMAFGYRFWQFEQQLNLLEYSMGKVSADSLREITIPYYDAISATVVERHTSVPGRPYLYRVGTFIPYFIPKNLEIIAINDHQLDVFNCLNQERDAELTVKRLKALGFNSIVFDTNTATIERDPKGSLHKKVDAFVDFVNDPKSHLQIPVSDTNAGLAFILIP